HQIRLYGGSSLESGFAPEMLRFFREIGFRTWNSPVLRWNRISHLECSGPYVKTLPPGHLGPTGTYTGDCACGIHKKTNILCNCRK
ncbi:hypothetical protein AVEN_3376-1, partial [Araneus ventricosus]